MKKIFVAGVFALFCLAVHAQPQNVYVFTFAPGSSEFSLSQGDNRAELQRLKAEVTARYQQIYGDTLAVFVKGYCKDNLPLATIRSNRIKSVLITEAGMREEFFVTDNSAGSMDGKTNLARVEVRIPQPQERLAENTERRKKAGEPVYGTVSMEAQEQLVEQPAVKEKKPVQKPEQPKPETQPNSTLPQSVEETQPLVPPAVAEKDYDGKFSIRTNLLYWLAATPNFGIEYHPSENFGILVNGLWSHWIWSDNDKHHRTWMVSPEVRYYIGANKNWFIGVEGHAGEFNFKFNDTGYQGDAIGGGLTGGYKLRLSEVFDLDFSLGLGYTQLKYDTYYRSNGYMVRKEGGLKKDFFGPTQLGVSLIFKL
ncbi:hypothetical protein FACS189416_5460 [Bacteroidia bacterium]|nr:hypothetical protein FACS189416_5460 [Bacteroidia bacterium]